MAHTTHLLVVDEQSRPKYFGRSTQYAMRTNKQAQDDLVKLMGKGCILITMKETIIM